jgi:hypothetical protein
MLKRDNCGFEGIMANLIKGICLEKVYYIVYNKNNKK